MDTMSVYISYGKASNSCQDISKAKNVSLPVELEKKSGLISVSRHNHMGNMNVSTNKLLRNFSIKYWTNIHRHCLDSSLAKKGEEITVQKKKETSQFSAHFPLTMHSSLIMYLASTPVR